MPMRAARSGLELSPPGEDEAPEPLDRRVMRLADGQEVVDVERIAAFDDRDDVMLMEGLVRTRPAEQARDGAATTVAVERGRSGRLPLLRRVLDHPASSANGS